MTGWRTRFATYRMPARPRFALTFAFATLTVVATVGGSVLTAAAGLFPPVDYDVFGRPGADILTGNWDRVFTDPILQAGPFELLVFGVPSLLGVDSVAGWAVFSSVLGLLLAAALAFVVERFVRPVSPDLAAPLAAAVAAVATVTATISQTVLDGHPAQIAIPVLWIVAAVLARRGSPLLAGVVLGASLGWELWGVLGVPVLLLAPRLSARTVLLSAAGGVGAVAVIFGGFVLAGPVTMFGFAWPIREGTLVAALMPDLETFSWPLRVTQAALSVGAGAAVALALPRRRDAVWLAPLAVCAVRLLTDPVLAGYYFRAPAVLCLAGLALAIALRSPLRVVIAIVLLNLAIDLTSIGWVGAAILVAGTLTAVVVLARRSEPSADLPSPA